jgi:hypothetical protein
MRRGGGSGLEGNTGLLSGCFQLGVGSLIGGTDEYNR